MIFKNRFFLIVLSLLFVNNLVFAEYKIKDIVAEVQKKSSVTESITYLNTVIPKITDAAEKRATYAFLASIQEQMSLYDDARKNYAAAAGISAGDAQGWKKMTNEQLVIDAVRCALCTGDYETADVYLASSVRNSKDSKIICYVKLYSQWSLLCRAQTPEDTKEPVEMLKAYLNVPSMKQLYPAILLTLWYVTGDKSYSSKITADFKNSPEAAIVNGDIQLMPAPFWFFVPKSGSVEQGTGTYTQSAVSTTSVTEDDYMQLH